VNAALVLLVLLWAALLIPSALRSRTGSPHATVGGFERAMDVLKTPSHRSGSRQLLVPGDAGRIVDHVGIAPAEEPRPFRREDPRVQTRRTWFQRLLAGTVVSLVLAVLFGGALWAVALLSVAATATYVVLLRRWKVQADQVRSVVRRLEAQTQAEPQRVPVGAAVGETSVRLRRWDA
jgi:ABC-type transport system involved in cytochrome bd biosynthesis fused ATPase/permease subunit